MSGKKQRDMKEVELFDPNGYQSVDDDININRSFQGASSDKGFLSYKTSENDLFCGFLMILFAIDHIYKGVVSDPNQYRHEIWYHNSYFSGDFLEFFSRQITHFAAPGFLLSLGIRCRFLYDSRSVKNGWSNAKIIGYFWVRGFILLALCVSMDSYTYGKLLTRNYDSYSVVMTLLWPIGWSIIISAPLLIFMTKMNNLTLRPDEEEVEYMDILGDDESCWSHTYRQMREQLGDLIMAMIIIILLIGTEFAVPSVHTLAEANEVPFVRSIFFVPRVFDLSSIVTMEVNYVIGPWLSVFLIGVLLAPIITSERFYMIIGLSTFFLSIFFLLRLCWFFEVFDFGNIRNKSHHANHYYSFWGLCKYPPSITYVMWTVGINLFILYVIKKFLKPRLEGTSIWKLLLLYGQSSLFFYLIHFTIIALLALPYPQGVAYHGYIYLILLNFLIIISPLCYLWQEFKTQLHSSSVIRMF